MSATTTPAGKVRRSDFGESPARVATAIIALVGFLLMLASVLFAVINSSWLWMGCIPLIILGVGVLAVGFFVVFNFHWLGDLVSGRAALSGLLVAVMCLAAVVVWSVGNYFFSYKGKIVLPKSQKTIPLTKSWDMTKAQKFTLSQKSIEQLKELAGPLTILVKGNLRVYQPESNDYDMQAEELLGTYKATGNQVSVEYLADDDASVGKLKAAAEKLHRKNEELPAGTVILLYKDQAKSFHVQDLYETRPMPMGNRVMQSHVFKGEEVITSAILQMLDSKKPKVYFVRGHGERDVEGRDQKGVSFMQERLQGDNMETATFLLPSAEKVPDDADLVLVIGPRQPFAPKELEVLKDYVVGRKGRLLVCLDEYRPEADLGLDGFMAEFGIGLGRDKVLELDRFKHPQDAPQLSLAEDFGGNPAVSRLREEHLLVVFGPARSVRRLEEYRGDWSVEPLVWGSEKSYGETDLDTLYSRGQASYKEGEDGPKPANYAVASWAGNAPMPGGRMEKELGRVVVVGDSNWCANVLWKARGNESFFSGTVKWMLGQEKRIVIESKKSDAQGFQLQPVQQYITWFAGAVMLVLLAMVAGLTAWIRRR
jgi:hypothetical protein